MSNKILVGQIVNVHGIKGAVKIKPFLNNPAQIGKLNPFVDDNGTIYELYGTRVHGETIIAGVKNVNNRNTAETLRGKRLYADKSKLPAANTDEYYYHDLVGLDVLQNDDKIGSVTAVNNYGASDILEITLLNGKVMDFAFTSDNFPVVDMQNKTICLNAPHDINGDTDED